MASPNMFDPIEIAHASPYFKRNHVGKVTCTLCNIYCNDEHAYIKHITGKTHTMQVERLERHELRKQRMVEEEQRNAEAEAAAEANKAAADLLKQRRMGGGDEADSGAVGRFGAPLYSFRTEHDEELFVTKVWLEFHFPKSEEGTRPLHRWVSAREQQMEPTADDYYVYLLVACEGYTTIALKFPSKVSRTQELDVMPGGTEGDSAYHCWWNPLRREYSLFFVLYR